MHAYRDQTLKEVVGVSNFISIQPPQAALSPVWRNQMVNIHVKHAPAAARPVGVIMLGYSVCGVLVSSLRGVDDDVNTLVAGVATGLIYKSAQAIATQSSLPLAKGAGVGALLGMIATFFTSESPSVRPMRDAIGMKWWS